MEKKTIQTFTLKPLLFNPLSNIAFSAPIGPLPYYNRIAARDCKLNPDKQDDNVLPIIWDGRGKMILKEGTTPDKIIFAILYR